MVHIVCIFHGWHSILCQPWFFIDSVFTYIMLIKSLIFKLFYVPLYQYTNDII